MAPIWALASRLLRKNLARKQVPLLALGAAFSFVVMFLNIPVAGRLTAHPVGAGLIAIICGPWAACIAISAALVVQAVPFGDGGITTLGINCLNLAVIAPFVSWGVFSLLRGFAPSPRRLWVASAASGYLGIVAAAIAVGVEVGLQPMLSRQGMYLPYSIRQTVPVMLFPHLLVISPIEAVITAAAVGYIYRTEPWLVRSPRPIGTGLVARKLAVVGVLFALMAPLGIFLPRLFHAGSAWGEWDVAELKRMLGYVPHGVAHGSRVWRAPLPGYALPGKEATPLWILVVAAVGAVVTIGVAYFVGRLISRGGKDATA
jgi:cobalt/nickel transport system permease protein